jgi:hypothetical protein
LEERKSQAMKPHPIDYASPRAPDPQKQPPFLLDLLIAVAILVAAFAAIVIWRMRNWP